jgi:hypothetical protein
MSTCDVLLMITVNSQEITENQMAYSPVTLKSQTCQHTRTFTDYVCSVSKDERIIADKEFTNKNICYGKSDV